MLTTRLLLIATLSFASVGYAQDDAKLDQILELLQTIKTEQDAQRADIDALKSDNAASVDSSVAEAESEEAPPEKKRESITRKKGWIASVHPVSKRNKVSAKLGKMVIDGFPMSHGVYKNKFDIDGNALYRSSGELLIEEDGEHTFQIRVTNDGLDNSFRGVKYTCNFMMKIEGKPVLSFNREAMERNKTRVWTVDIDLVEGFYKLAMEQACSGNGVIWDFYILTPNAMDAVSVGNDAIFYREK